MFDYKAMCNGYLNLSYDELEMRAKATCELLKECIDKDSSPGIMSSFALPLLTLAIVIVDHDVSKLELLLLYSLEIFTRDDEETIDPDDYNINDLVTIIVDEHIGKIPDLVNDSYVCECVFAYFLCFAAVDGKITEEEDKLLLYIANLLEIKTMDTLLDIVQLIG